MAMVPNHPLRRRALLIGVNYVGSHDWFQLTGQQDALHFKKFLVEDKQWQEDDIVLMLDSVDGSCPPELMPTQANIRREITSFTANARKGDHFVFFFAGHSHQLPSKGTSEEDGLDEVIVPCDCNVDLDRPIIDNELKRLLVDPLPGGTSLTAVFDSCHSGTLLDLPHYYCNAVYVPWVNKGQRHSDTLRNSVVRELAYNSAVASQKTKFPSLPRSALRNPLTRVALSPLNTRGRAPWITHVDSPVPSPMMSPATSPTTSPAGSPSMLSPHHTLVPLRAPSPQHTLMPPRAPSTQHTLMPRRTPSPQHTLMPPRAPSPQRPLLPRAPTPQQTTSPNSLSLVPSPEATLLSRGSPRPRRPTLRAQLTVLTAEPPGSVSAAAWASFFGGIVSPMRRCASPEPMPGSECDGYCKFGDGTKARVVSLSACADQERAWEDWNGATMTSSLLDILRQYPGCSYHHLLTHLSHRLHKTARHLHKWTRDRKRTLRRAAADDSDENVSPGSTPTSDPGELTEADTYEMDNFQNPQLSSLERLNMDETFLL